MAKAVINSQPYEFEEGVSVLEALVLLVSTFLYTMASVCEFVVVTAKRALPVRITSSVKPGELFATFHTLEASLNRMTSSHRDRYVKTPEYKVTAVRIEKQIEASK